MSTSPTPTTYADMTIKVTDDIRPRGARRNSICTHVKRGAIMLAAAAALAVSSTVAAPEASADASFTVGAVTYNCGIATCSTYISRSGTQSMDRFLDNKAAQYGSWAAETVVCSSMGKIPYVGVPLGIYCGFRFVQLDQVLDEAADKNKCFKVTYLPTGTVTHISTNNGQYCKN